MRYIEIDARNVWFTKPEENVIEKLYNKAGNEFVKKYVKSTFRTYLINEYPNVTIVDEKLNPPSWVDKAIEKGDTVYKLDIKGSDIIKWEHYIDYLNTLPHRPIKMSFSDLEKHVKEWEKSFAKQKANKEDGIELLHKYNNGFSWVKVFGKESLTREGKLMNHCVGGYYQKVKNNDCEIYSLRDKNNTPHITIEYRVKNRTIIQIKGNSNQPPKDKYIKYLNDLLKKKYIPYTEVEQTDLVRCGLFYQDNQVYKLESMPEGFILKGNLDLDNFDKDIKLPKGLIIDGYLSIEYSAITSLPENLVVKGTFYAEESALKYVPKSCSFGKDIDISKTSIKKWEIEEVKRNFIASNSDLTYLPDNFIVHGDCDLSETKISYIENIAVEGYLDIFGCKYLDPNSIGSINVKKTLILPSSFPYVYGEHIVAGDIDGGREIESEYDE